VTNQPSLAKMPGMRAEHGPSPWILIPIVILTNITAMTIQMLWARDEMATLWPSMEPFGLIILAVFWAVTLESCGVYLSAMAHAARLADQSAGFLQTAAYGVGALMGALNYSHFAGWTKPNAIAIGAGMASVVSPWFWAIWSKYRSRARLAELGQVDKRAVKLSTARKFWHPFRSLGVVRHATWAGTVEPDAAVQGWEQAREETRLRKLTKQGRGNALRTAEAFPERDRRPVVRPVIIRQHRTTVRRVRLEITDRPASFAPVSPPPQSPWADPQEAIAYPISPAGPSGFSERDGLRMNHIRQLVAQLGRVPGRDKVIARWREHGLGAGSSKADQLLAEYKRQQEVNA
jgi:hypothetical protein